MTDRILFRARAWENTISIQTYTPRMKSPQRFYITYSELDRLQSEDSIISNDIHSFVVLRLDERRDRITFEFTWLSGRSFDRVEGHEQTVHLRWSKFRDYLDTVRQPDCPEEDKIFRALSLGVSKSRPRLVFDGSRANLHAAIADPVIRRKLSKALMANFNWPYAEEIHLTNDFVPYSFFFREFQGGRACMCGGLILHGQDDMSKAYYGIHT